MKYSAFLHFIIIIMCCVTSVSAKVITNVTYNNKKYFVDIVDASTKTEVKSEVWFRVSDKAPAKGDIKVAVLSANTKKLNTYSKAACRTYEIFDAGTKVAGCAGLIGSAFCAVATTATEGAAAFACETVWTYTAEKGAADCLKGTAQAISNYLGHEKTWSVVAALANIKYPELSESVMQAIDFMCSDIKDNK